jgi:uncharacterized protein
MANDKEIYSSGVFGEIVLHRAVQFYIVGMPLRLALVTWRCLPLFLMGLQTISFLGFSNIGANPILTVMVISGMILGFPVLGLAYAGGISLLCLKDKFVPMLRPLAAAGRMALSNYVGQSIICGFIFNSYGLGLYGELNPLATIIIAIMLLIFQIAFSVFWLNCFQFGPLEWIWKSLTYMKKPGFIKSRSAVSTAKLEVKNEYR